MVDNITEYIGWHTNWPLSGCSGDHLFGAPRHHHDEHGVVAFFKPTMAKRAIVSACWVQPPLLNSASAINNDHFFLATVWSAVKAQALRDRFCSKYSRNPSRPLCLAFLFGGNGNCCSDHSAWFTCLLLAKPLEAGNIESPLTRNVVSDEERPHPAVSSAQYHSIPRYYSPVVRYVAIVRGLPSIDLDRACLAARLSWLGVEVLGVVVGLRWLMWCAIAAGKESRGGHPLLNRTFLFHIANLHLAEWRAGVSRRRLAEIRHRACKLEGGAFLPGILSERMRPQLKGCCRRRSWRRNTRERHSGVGPLHPILRQRRNRPQLFPRWYAPTAQARNHWGFRRGYTRRAIFETVWCSPG